MFFNNMSECDLALIYTITAVLGMLLSFEQVLGWSSCDANSISQLIIGGCCLTKNKEIVESEWSD